MPIKTPARKKPSLVRRVIATFAPTDRGAAWESAAKITTAFGLFLVPVVVAPWGTDPWEIQKGFVLVLTVVIGWACLAIAMLRRGSDRWSWHPLDILVLVFGLVATVGTITSVHWWSSVFGVPGWTNQSLIVIWAMIGLYFLVARLFVAAADRRLVWTIVLVSLGLSLIAQLFQFAGLSLWPDPLRESQWFSVIGNLNLHLSIAAAIFGAAMLMLWTTESERWAKLLLSLGLMLSWLVLFFSGRALGWAVFALGMIIVVLHQSREQKRVNMRLIVAAIAVAVLGMIAQVTNISNKSGLPSYQELTLGVNTTTATTMATLAERPVLGTGPSTWYYAFVSHRPESFTSSPVWDVRFTQGGQAWLQLFATMGIAGAVIFFGLLLLGASMAWRAWRRSGDPFLLITILAIAVTLVSGFLTLWSFPLLFLTCAMLGLARATVGADHAPTTRPLPPLAYAGLSLGAILIIGIMIPFVGVYLSDVYLRRAIVQAGDQVPVDQVIRTLKTAQTLNGRNTEAVKLLANAYGAQVQNAVQAQKMEEASAALTKFTSLIDQAIARDRNNPQLYETENEVLNVLSYAIPDAVNRAQENFRTLRQIEPVNPIHDVAYGQTVMTILRQRQQTDQTVTDAQVKAAVSEAIVAYDEAINKKPGYFQAYLSKMQALVDGKQYEAALSVFSDRNRLSDVEAAYVALVSAQAYDGQGNPTDAALSVATTIPIFSTDPNVYLQTAEYFLKAEKKEEARKVLTQGQTALPKDESIAAKLKELAA